MIRQRPSRGHGRWRVGVEQVVTGHAWLPGDTSRDEDDLSALQALLDTLRCRFVALDVALGVDVANVGGNTWAALDVVKSKLRDTRVELQEEGEGLANTTSRAKDSDLGGIGGSLAEGPA